MNGSVLLVEDDEPIRVPLTNLLRGEGYTVHVAVNGTEALQLLRRIARPDVVLLDLMMPEMNGSQMLSVLRNEKALRDIPVIIMSAWLHRWTERAAGADHVLVKPIDTDRLLNLIARYSAPPTTRKVS